MYIYIRRRRRRRIYIYIYIHLYITYLYTYIFRTVMKEMSSASSQPFAARMSLIDCRKEDGGGGRVQRAFIYIYIICILYMYMYVCISIYIYLYVHLCIPIFIPAQHTVHRAAPATEPQSGGLTGSFNR